MSIYKSILFASIFLSLLACEQPERDSIRFGLQTSPATLDPRYDTEALSTRINRLLYQQMVEFNDRYIPIPSLTKWRKINPRHYRFEIIGKNYFHDGDLLTAHDIKASYDSAMDKKNASPHGASFKMVKSIRVLNDKTLDFLLTKADGFFPAYLVLGIAQKKYIDQGIDFSRNPKGSGPFEFLSWHQSHLRLKRRRDGQIVEFHWIKDPVVRVLKLVRGEIDLLQNEIPQEYESYLKDQEHIYIGRKQGTNFAYLGFNMEDTLTSNKQLRKAIAYGINRQEIIQHIWGERARLAESILGIEHWAGVELDAHAYSPSKARQLVKQYFKSPPKLVYKTSSSPFRIRLATIIQYQLKQVGIEVEIKSYDWGTFFDDIKNGNFQMYSLQWVGIKSPEIYKYVFHSSNIPPKGANRGRYRNSKIDALLDEATSSDSLEKQAKLYSEIQHIIHDDLPFVPLWYENHFFAARNNIKNYKLASDGNYDGLIQVQRLTP